VADFGKLATDYLRSWLAGPWVMVEAPATAAADPSGHRFALVYRGSDARLANETLVENGYGVVPKAASFPLAARLREKEAAARAARRGLFGKRAADAAEFGSGRKSQASYLDKVKVGSDASSVEGEPYLGFDAASCDCEPWVSEWLAAYD
jgi:endonuclease YncB( thermonuclease family)